jgi:hypothetical protein
MGRGFNIPWVSGQNTMGGVEIPWIGGENTMGRGSIYQGYKGSKCQR